MNAKEYREFYKTNIREDTDNLRDINFIGCYHRENNSLVKKGFFELYHGDKEDEKNFLMSPLNMAEDGQVIYEFIQNAVDANSNQFSIFWDEDNFLVINNGKKFQENEIKSILNVSQSTKLDDDTNKIGKFGIGFKLIHRLVGKSNGLDEIIDEYKGPLLFSWDKSYIKTFLEKDLRNIDKHWFFKILYTNFPCGLEETIKDKKYKDRVPFKKTEYNDLINFINKQNINLDSFEEGTIFFLKLGEGKNQLLHKELVNLKDGVKYSLNIIESFVENREKKLHNININGLEIKPEKMDYIKSKNYIFLLPINEEQSILFFKKNNSEKISFFKFFPMGEQRNALNFILHSDKFEIEANRRQLQDTVINQELLIEISNSLKDEFNKIKSSDINRYRNILLNLYLSNLETANDNRLIKEYLTSSLYSYIQTNIPTKNNQIVSDKNLVKIIDSKLNVSLKKYSEFYFKDKKIIEHAEIKLKIDTWNIFHILINDDIENWVQKLNEKDYQQFLYELNSKYKHHINIKDKIIFLFGKFFLSINGIRDNYFFRGNFDKHIEDKLEKLGFIFSDNDMSNYQNLLQLNKKEISSDLFNREYSKLQTNYILDIFKEYNIKNFAIIKIEKDRYHISSNVSHSFIEDEKFKEFIEEQGYDKTLNICLVPDEFQDKVLNLLNLRSSDKKIKELLIKEIPQKIIDFISEPNEEKYFLSSLNFLHLDSQKNYSKDSYEIKVLDILIKFRELIEKFKEKIFIDEVEVSKLSKSPFITFKYQTIHSGKVINPNSWDNNLNQNTINFIENLGSKYKDIFNIQEESKEIVYEDIKESMDFYDYIYPKEQVTINTKNRLKFIFLYSLEKDENFIEEFKGVEIYNKQTNADDSIKILYEILIKNITKEANLSIFNISDFFPNIFDKNYYIESDEYGLKEENILNKLDTKYISIFKTIGLNIDKNIEIIRKIILTNETLDSDKLSSFTQEQLLNTIRFLSEKKFRFQFNSIDYTNIEKVFKKMDKETIINSGYYPILEDKDTLKIINIHSALKYYILKNDFYQKSDFFQKRLEQEIKDKKIIYFDILGINYTSEIIWEKIEEDINDRNNEAKRKIKQEKNDIDNRLSKTSDYNERTAEIGRKGELLVKDILIDKFGIDRVRDNNLNGEKKKIDFEILDTDLITVIHKIEVKSTVNKVDKNLKESVEFYMSKEQYLNAQEYGKDTHLIFVTGVESHNPKFLYMNFDMVT